MNKTERMTTKGEPPVACPDLPPPPYLNRGTRQVTITARFDPAAIRTILPPELEMVDQATGGFHALEVTSGWGLAPYTKSACWIDVVGFDAADGSHGRYYWQGYLSGKAFEYYNSVFSRYYLRGGVAFMEEGEITEASCGDGVHEYFRLMVRVTKEEPVRLASGVMSCLGSSPAGGLVHAPVPFTHTMRSVTPLGVSVTAPSDSRLAKMRPTSLVSAYTTDEFSYTAGLARKLVGAREEPSESLFKLLAHEGRGALLVDESGQILFGNEIAFDLLNDGLLQRSNSLIATDPEVQDKLRRLIYLASSDVGAGQNWETISVQRTDHSSPLLVTALPTELSHTTDVTGRPVRTVVVLITDPALRADRPPSSTLLLLLGLTPGEARLAAAMASGKGRKQAADSLGLTEATVRVTLSTIYAKLGVSGQRELGRLGSLLGPLA